ncbi:MAG: gamma-glutamylcyclotransferase family protein [Solirubrobacterales bacterium]
MAVEDHAAAYVFGYGSLVELTRPLVVGGQLFPAVPGRLQGFRRRWGVAMNNWEAREDEKHFVDPETGLKPKLAVAYLDIEEAPGEAVNGLAIPVDAARLRELDAREINYERFDASAAFEPALARAVFAYQGTAAARRRRQPGAGGAAIYASRQYVERIERAFAALGPGQLAEYERTTEPLPFPVRELEPRYPLATGGDP